MKSILYVGATLMIGASIYGFADYKKTSRKSEFRKMYDEKEVVVVPDATEEIVVDEIVPVPEEKIDQTKTVEKKKTVKKRIRKVQTKKWEINAELFSRARPPRREMIMVDTVQVLEKKN